MKSLFSVVCLTVLVGMATSCCLPDQGSFDFKMQLNSTATYMGRSMPQSMSFSGSGVFDFTEQMFYLSIPQYKAKAFIDLKNKKMATLMSTYPTDDGLETMCSANRIGGKIGKPWQCVLDNDNIFINVEGSENYLLYIPPMAYGLVTLEKGTCLPTGAEVEYVLNTTYFSVQSIVRLELTVVDKIKDESVLKAPCKADRTTSNVFQIPTPDGLVQILKQQFAADSEHASEAESEASPESDKSKSDDPSDAGEESSQVDAGSESSNDADDESESEEKKEKKDVPYMV